MDEEEKVKMNAETRGNASVSKGYLMGPWHSTPVKKNLFGNEETETDASRLELRDESRPLQKPSKPASFSSSLQTPVNGLEISTIQKQRSELQCLIAELKDRETELNAMATAHHRQLLSWEQDRQRVLILEQRCARQEDELQKRNDVIRVLSKRTKSVEAREKDVRRELNITQQQLHEMNQTQLNASRHQQDLEEKNQSLSSTIVMLSSQVGQLQVREEELSSMLKLKDKDVIEATNRILDLSGRLCELEKSLEELRTSERKTLQELEKQKHGFRESRNETSQLKAEIREKTFENNRQREEIIRIKQENQLLKKELNAVEFQLLNEDQNWKDELLEISRSKQARAESELLCLRQVCENQQNDLQLLKLNLESAREALRHHEGQRSPGSTADLSCLNLSCQSPGSGRSSGRLHDSALSVEFSGTEEGYNSSTSRLQRLLAESREMVANLECASGKSVSPDRSPTNGQLQTSHAHDSHHSQSQSSNRSQESRESDSKSGQRFQQGNKDLDL